MQIPPLHQLAATHDLARGAMKVGDYRGARALLRVLTAVVTAANECRPSPEREALLAACLADLSACEGGAGEAEAPVPPSYALRAGAESGRRSASGSSFHSPRRRMPL